MSEMINMSDNEKTQSSKFGTNNCVEFIDQSHRTCNKNH